MKKNLRMRRIYVFGELALVAALAFGAQLLADIVLGARFPQRMLPLFAALPLIILGRHVLRRSTIGFADDTGLGLRCRRLNFLGWLNVDKFRYLKWSEIESIEVSKPEDYPCGGMIESRSFEGNPVLFIKLKVPGSVFYCRDYFKAIDGGGFMKFVTAKVSARQA